VFDVASARLGARISLVPPTSKDGDRGLPLYDLAAGLLGTSEGETRISAPYPCTLVIRLACISIISKVVLVAGRDPPTEVAILGSVTGDRDSYETLHVFKNLIPVYLRNVRPFFGVLF
jgi:hypothetical protein